MKKNILLILFLFIVLSSFIFAKGEIINTTLTKDDYYKDKIDIINKTEYDKLKEDVYFTNGFIKSQDDININSQLLNYWVKDKYLYFEILANDTYTVSLNNNKPLKYNKKDNVLIVVFDYVKYWRLHVGASSDVWLNEFPNGEYVEVYYHPNVTGSVVIDESLNTTQRNATLNGATYISTGNHYIVCDGNSQFVDMSYDVETLINGAFTFSVWLQTTVTANYKTIYGQYTGVGDYFQITNNWASPSRLALYVEGTGGIDLAYFTNATLIDGNWHLLTVTKKNTYTANDWAFYLDGDLQSKTVSSDSATSNYLVGLVPDICRQTRSGAGSTNYADINFSNFILASYEFTAQDVEDLYNITQTYYLTPPTDNTPPYVTDITPVNNASFVNNSNVNIKANATDISGINVSIINITFPNGTTVNYTLIKETKDYFNYTLNVVNNGTYNVSFIFSDNLSNINDTEKTYFTVYYILPSNETGITEGDFTLNDISTSASIIIGMLSLISLALITIGLKFNILPVACLGCLLGCIFGLFLMSLINVWLGGIVCFMFASLFMIMVFNIR